MFCKYCGNEVEENTVVCPKCGCLIGGFAQEIRNEENIAVEQPKPSRKYFRLAKIFSIVGTVLSCVTVLCALWFCVLMYAALSSGNTSGVNYGGMAIAVFALFGIYGMLIVSPFALTTGILAFIFKRKSPERTGAFPVVAFVLGLISFAATILFFIVLCS